jgi:hypothetical protein
VKATSRAAVNRAAAFLGVAPSKVRLRIESDDRQPIFEVSRPQGVVWRVHLPPEVLDGDQRLAEPPRA